jgi:4-hydroxy 2-oxovalerate aldolase
MGKIHLLDCTLRDGGYINNWAFGEDAIKGVIRKLELTGIEMIEVGFMRKVEYNPDYSLFPTVESFKNVIEDKKKRYIKVTEIPYGVNKLKLVNSIEQKIDNGILTV